MTRWALRSAQRRRALGGVRVLALAFATFGAVACREEVPLGSWLSEAGGQGGESGEEGEPSAGVPGVSGGAAGAEGGEGGARDGGARPMFPACLEPGNALPINAAGDELGITETWTDWTLPNPVESMEWELSVERDVIETEPPTSGYYYQNRFSFVGGATGIFGIQSEGVYQSDPPSSTPEITKMAVFWLSGPPLRAELGDIAYPNARVAPATANGVNWLTIHARFAWEVCHVYRFRVAPESTDEEGNAWYGAWIDDTTTGDVTFLGRMLLPPDAGLISASTASRVLPIAYTPLSCAVQSPSSAVYAAPRGNGGTVSPSFRTNYFESPARCATSRFTNFDDFVRHEVIAP